MAETTEREAAQYTHGYCAAFAPAWHEPVEYEDGTLMWMHLPLEPPSTLFGGGAVKVLQCRVCCTVYVPRKKEVRNG